jgi:hypothetical protein
VKTAIALTVGIVMPFGFIVLAALLIKAVLARYRCPAITPAVRPLVDPASS